MRLEWLEDLLAVTETGSFQEAAEHRFLTQSAFSRRIRNIEDLVGVELFDRSRKPVQPHPVLVEKQEQIQRLAVDLRQLVEDLRLDARAASNRVILGSQHALTLNLAPHLLKRIRQQNERIHVRVRSGNFNDCFALLLSRMTDIIIVYDLPGVNHPVSDGYIESARIGADRLIPVFEARSMTDLSAAIARNEMPYINYPGDVFFGSIVRRLILPRLPAGIRPLPVAETALTLAAFEMASIGIGVAWVPERVARQRIQEGAVVDLTELLYATEMDITAVKLSGVTRPAADEAWLRIASGEIFA